MFKTYLYVQVFENLIRAKNVQTGVVVDKLPTAPFTHERALVGTFSEAEVTVRQAVKEVKGSGLFKSTYIVIQPMSKIEGGLTEVESRVLRELALGSGAAKAELWVGKVLSNEEVIEKLS